MDVDYPGALNMMLPIGYSFSSVAPLTIVCHKTAGNGTLQSLYNTFDATMRSTHFGIGLDGSVAQFVPLNRGAGGNCCVETGYNTFWDPYLRQYGNLNFCTISIEHCDPTGDNSFSMPLAQVAASNKLIKWLCNKFNIDTTHIHSHASIDPIDRSRCPGPTFDFQQLFTYINTGGPLVITTPQQAEMDAIWEQTKDLPQFAGTPPRTGTGIYEDWIRGYLMGHRFGSPTSNEFPLTDFSGNAMVAQNFENALCYWRNNAPHWYDGHGAIVF